MVLASEIVGGLVGERVYFLWESDAMDITLRDASLRRTSSVSHLTMLSVAPSWEHYVRRSTVEYK
jgi:hypothetical protein